MCTVLLPPDDNPIAVNKYIYGQVSQVVSYLHVIRLDKKALDPNNYFLLWRRHGVWA